MSHKKQRKNNQLKSRPWIIGIDETNNGAGIKSKNPHQESSTIIIGYLMKDPFRANYGKCKYERKGWAFGRNSSIENTLRRAREYLSINKDFFYTSISRESQRVHPMSVLKAEAISAITMSFIMKYHLKAESLKIVTDQLDGPSNSEEAHIVLDYYLKNADLDIPHKSRLDADRKVVAVKRADVIGYCINGIHLNGTNHNWPFRSRKVSLKDLERLTIQVQEIDYEEYTKEYS